MKKEYYYYVLQRKGKTAMHELYKKPLIFNTQQEAKEHIDYLEKNDYKPVKVFISFNKSTRLE